MFETETSLPQKRDLSSIEVRRGQFPKLEKFSKNFKISPQKNNKRYFEFVTDGISLHISCHETLGIWICFLFNFHENFHQRKSI